MRIALGVGLLALGYYVGRGVGRSESMRRDLDAAERETAAHPGSSPTEPESDRDQGPVEGGK